MLHLLHLGQQLLRRTRKFQGFDLLLANGLTARPPVCPRARLLLRFLSRLLFCLWHGPGRRLQLGGHKIGVATAAAAAA